MKKNTKHQESLSYEFFYWGPMLFKTEIRSQDLKVFAKLCSKKSSFVNDTLAGVIKHQHYISTSEYYKIITSYLDSFRHCHQRWYGNPLTRSINVVSSWVNFMGPGEFNPPHVHANCDFSSVLFIKVPEKLKEENKKFQGYILESGGGPGAISFTYGEAHPYSLSHKNFFPKEGDLYIFPATLTHFVAPFMCKEERISISANFKFE